MSTRVEMFDVLPAESIASEVKHPQDRDQTDPQESDGHAETATVAKSDQQAAKEASHIVLHRDPDDVRMLVSFGTTGLLLVLLLLLSLVGNLYLYARGPMLVIKDPRDGRVLQINGEVFGSQEAVQYGPDRLTDDDKRYLSGKFAKYLYQVDGATRPKDIERALRMMVPMSAVELVRKMKAGELGLEVEQQRSESWQTIWEPQRIVVDRDDPYKIQVVGRQLITKTVANQMQQESRQLAFTLKLVIDSQRRADRNERSGFLVGDIQDFQIINEPHSGQSPEASSKAISD